MVSDAFQLHPIVITHYVYNVIISFYTLLPADWPQLEGNIMNIPRDIEHQDSSNDQFTRIIQVS